MENNPLARTVFVECDINTLIGRDPKGLYRRALLPDGNPEKIHNFTGISDPFQTPSEVDLVLNTDEETVEESVKRLISFIFKETED